MYLFSVRFWRIAACVLVLASVCMQQAKAQTFTCDVGGLYYLCDKSTHEAVLIACQKDEGNGYVYLQDDVFVPATITVSGASMGGEGGGSESSNTFAVTEIAENALAEAWAFSITFEKPSNLRVIRKRGLYDIGVSGSFALPEGLQVIEEEGLYVKSSNKATQFISKLVLPASLDSLGKSAIVLNKLQTLQFLGTTPPKCHYTEDSNPWKGTDTATPEDVEIQIPAGTDDAYNNRKGIGTYFAFFPGPAPEVPTGMEEVTGGADGSSAGPATKLLRNGQVLILRDGRCYSLLGQEM